MLMLISGMFARDYVAVNAKVNGVSKIVEVEERAYYTLCVNGFKWVQFIKITEDRDNKVRAINDWLPVQMLSNNMPLKCD